MSTSLLLVFINFSSFLTSVFWKCFAIFGRLNLYFSNVNARNCLPRRQSLIYFCPFLCFSKLFYLNLLVNLLNFLWCFFWCLSKRIGITLTNFECKSDQYAAEELGKRTGIQRLFSDDLPDKPHKFTKTSKQWPIKETRMSKNSSIKFCLLSNSERFSLKKLRFALFVCCSLIVLGRPVQSQKVCDQILPIGKYGFPSRKIISPYSIRRMYSRFP